MNSICCKNKNNFKNIFYKINSISVMISILMKSNLNERCVVSAPMSINNEGLRDYLRLACIYGGNSNKNKTDLIEMIF